MCKLPGGRTHADAHLRVLAISKELVKSGLSLWFKAPQSCKGDSAVPTVCYPVTATLAVSLVPLLCAPARPFLRSWMSPCKIGASL